MKLLRPLVERLQAYVPGEQPKDRGLIKLNTNENPYPPSPRVLQAVKRAVDGRLRLYPNPTAQALRERLAQWHQCTPDHILVGNGSDEILALAIRAFAEPAQGRPRSLKRRGTNQTVHRSTVQFFDPSYSLYPVLVNIHGSNGLAVPLTEDFSLPSLPTLQAQGIWDFQAALSLVTTPNAPTGRGYATAELASLCQTQRGVVLLDETYVDFAEENAMRLALEMPNVLVARTFSKAYSLCFQRVGYVVGHPALITGLMKTKDSYNVNGLGQVAALATLDDLNYYQANFKRIVATRNRLVRDLRELDFEVLPSQTNFIFVRPPVFSAEEWLKKLREQRILVRWFAQPRTRDYLRISIGTEAEMRSMLRCIRSLLSIAAGSSETKAYRRCSPQQRGVGPF
jgi:histidinol-phosphate aminotransferase